MVRHPARLAAICLILGASTTILVSWLLVFDLQRAMRPMRFARATADINRPDLSIARRDAFGTFSIAAARPFYEPSMPAGQTVPLDEIVPPWARHELFDCWLDPTQSPPPEGGARAILATGWPAPSMWASFDQQPSPNYWWFKSRNGIVIAPAPAFPDHFTLLAPRERVLPLRIVWPGFILSAMFWSACWTVVLLLPLWIRRTLRKRRGRCLACGYDRRGHGTAERCPECGARAA